MDERETIDLQDTEEETQAAKETGGEAALDELPEEIQLPTARIAYVMAIVAVLCGGNGIGIVAAGLFWKSSRSLPGAIGIVAAATAVAIVLVAVIVLLHKRHVKKNLEQ